MKKHLVFFAILFIATGALSFAADSGKTICIQGFGSRDDYVAFFRDSFMAEAAAAGFRVSEQFDFKYADYGIRFDLAPNANVSGKQFLFKVDLVRIRDLSTIATATYLFSELEEMIPYLQYLFFRLVANIPEYRTGGESTAWRNKWLYLRFSFDYPITVYELQGDGLQGDAAVYSDEDPPEISMLDNRINALPGGTFGLEFQFLDWMSFELGINVAMQDLFRADYYYAVAAQAELKFPIKTNYLIFAPYLAASYPIAIPGCFVEYPPYSIGGGIQICLKGGPSGAFFIDINYMHSFDKAIMENPFKDTGFPNPDTIHYRRFLVGLGIGYKLGFIDRK